MTNGNEHSDIIFEELQPGASYKIAFSISLFEGMKTIKGHFNPGLFNPRLFNHELFNPKFLNPGLFNPKSGHSGFLEN